MSENYLNRKLLEQFRKQGVMTRIDLFNFFRQYEPELNESAITWRIFDLKRRNIIRDLKRGIYTLQDKQLFVPELDETIVSISKLIERLYDSHFYNIWDTRWLNELIELQTISSTVVLETERANIDSVFFTLKDHKFHEVFTKPDESLIEKYVSEAKHPIVIKPFISRPPIQVIQGVKVPTLEKILVDLYCDEHIFFAFQGHQLEDIYKNAATRYHLNFSKLFTYAKRRSREDEVKNLFKTVLDDDLKNIIE